MLDSTLDRRLYHSVALRSESSLGLGRLLSGARASTNGDSVGAPLAAFGALGNKFFSMSHRTACLPLAQVSAYLSGLPISVKIHKNGSVFATIFDYVFRNQFSEEMNMWNFVSTMKTVKIRSRSLHSLSGKDVNNLY